MVSLVKHDLEFILKQIKIAEAHAAGGDLATLVGNPLAPYGLRTVDGSHNNLIPGRVEWGAADNQFPPMVSPGTPLNDGDGDSMNFGPGGVLTNTDYGATGDVADADPRLISNLIVDQSLANPAVIIAALEHAEYQGDITAAVTALQQGYATYQALAAAVAGNEPELAPIRAAWQASVAAYGIEMDGTTVILPNVSPDIGDSAPYSSIFTIFGQFFDHGLDHVAKGNNGTIYIPLSPDDPLYDPTPGARTNFMAVSRASTSDGAMNTTTPWVDQNQTYGSHASVQVFLREYILIDGKPVATGHLLTGAQGGMATWGDVKKQAADILGIRLTDNDVGSVPLLATDEYGNFIPGANGFPQLVVGFGANDLVEGVAGAGAVDPAAVGAFRTAQAFLLDIAHRAAPGFYDDDHNPATPSVALVPDNDTDAGNLNPAGTYDNELLDAHFIAGDGRANENIGLTAIHHVFHAEHNRVVEHAKDVILATGDVAFLNEWLLNDVTSIPDASDPGHAAWAADLLWDGERLFQAGRFTTEMEYQHLVFEEFARKMQPDVDAFLFEPDPDINPAIFAEFAHVVYRFGHSMLRETIDRVHTDGATDHIDLFEGFLNPLAYDKGGALTHDVAVGAIMRGLSGQVGNEIDEFVTNVLRNQLVGIPLDLAAINIARGRDTNMPTLNEARAQLKAAAGGDSQLDPYVNWVDFALNLKNPASIVNFIAAYGTHEAIAEQDSVAGKRAAAMAIVFGTNQTFLDGITNTTKVILASSITDRLDFLNGTAGWSGMEAGLNNVDFWIGGLAEKKMDFGGMLGSTFSAVFELQLENLQDGDRFYYLSRVQGLNLLSELEGNSLAKIVLRNTDLGEDGSAIPSDIFSRPDLTLYLDAARQLAMTGLSDPEHGNPTLQAISQLVERRDANGDGVADYLRYNGGDHVVIQGTSGNDTIIGGEGDDTLWGGAGNDRLEGGYGVDHVHGGAGNDIITNAGADIGAADFLHGEEGHDVIHGGSGLALTFGNQGQDFMVAGPDGKTVMGGVDNDFILGGDGMDFLLGEAGDDWIEGGGRFDTLAGENSELFFNSSIIGHDVLNGQRGDVDYDAEAGDDIMFQGVGIQRSNGMAGFDWAIHKGDEVPANSDLGIPIFATQENFILRDRFDLVEGLSGWKYNDVLTGRVAPVNTRAELTGTAAIPGPDSILDSYSNALLEKNISLVAGLDKLVAHAPRHIQVGNDGTAEVVALETSDATDILLGGGGSDRIKGLAGNDVIDGDMWLNVRIAVYARDANGELTDTVIATADGMTGKLYNTPAGLAAKDPADLYNPAGAAGSAGMTLDQAMFSRALDPGQLQIVREVLNGNQAGDIDTAAYIGPREQYGFGVNRDGSLYVNHAPPAADETETLGDNVEGVTARPVLDGRDTVRNIERLEFTDLTMNVINGADAGETLNGNAPGTGLIHDVIMGFGGNDTLNGGTGDDVLIGGVGDDRLDGGAGDDRYIYGLNDGQDVIQESGGNDRISIAADGVALGALNFMREQDNDLRIDINGTRITVTDHFDSNGAVIETIAFDSGSYGGYDFYLADDEGDEVFRGAYALSTDDNGELTAAADVDTILIDRDNNQSSTLTGNTGDDMLFGNGGNDTLNGGSGVDLLVGGSGNDTYTVDDPGDTVVELANGGTDTVRTSLVSYNLDANVEALVYTGAADFTGSGNGLNNTISGGAGADSLYGGDGADTLNGGAGNDALHGGAGNDMLNGEAGNDVLTGGAGDDTIDVGNGFNIIVYDQAGFGADVINSFDAAGGSIANQDKIDLSGLGVTAANFNQRVFESSPGGGATLLTIREGGPGSAIQGAIRINGVTANNIDQSDFILAPPVINGTNSANTLSGAAAGDVINGLGGNDVIDGFAGNDVIDGGAGDDTINGGSGDDVVRWTAPANGSAGWDVIDGGSEGSAGDAFEITGSASYEIFRIYPAEDALAVVPGLTLRGAATEIVITRTTVVNGVEGTPQVIAELAEIEEIIINGSPASGVGEAGGDRFELIGNFAELGEETSLRTSTITILGSGGSDTVDISKLASAHRVVFKTSGGNDVIIGKLRPQDVVELEAGKTLADYARTKNADGSTTMSSGAHTVTFFSEGEGPQFTQGGAGHGDGGDGSGQAPVGGDDGDQGDSGGDDREDDLDPVGGGDDAGAGEEGQDDEEEDDDAGNDDNGHDDAGCGQDEDDDVEDGVGQGGPTNPVPSGGGAMRIGAASADVLTGAAGNDSIFGLAGDDVLFGEAGDDMIAAGDGSDHVDGGAGRDTIFAGDGDDRVFAGAGNDLIHGEAGDDRIFGHDGDDIIDAGAGNDTVVGGAGGDLFIASAGDGADTYYGDDIDGGVGIDTLDLSAISANLTVDLGSGLLGRGAARSSESGVDTLWGIENVATGSGDDVITASHAVNVMEGGAGEDVFRFLDVASADGDVIFDFEPGDLIDLSGIDANAGTAGNQGFTLVSGPEFNAAAQLMVSWEERDGVAYTIVQGNVSGGATEDFRIALKGSHDLNASSFVL
ncbi:peroxidase family protein [Camelimonas sp. ID_303_24]